MLRGLKEKATHKDRAMHAARKFHHNEMMRRIGKAGQTKTTERICSKCKVEYLSETYYFGKGVKRTGYCFEFWVCQVEGVHSSARLPQKITPATTDRRPRRDWQEVTDVVEALTPDSQQ